MSLPTTITKQHPDLEPSTCQTGRSIFVFLDFLFCLAVLHSPLMIILATGHTPIRVGIYFGCMLGLSTFGALHAMYMALNHSSRHENLVHGVYHGVYMLASFCIVFDMLESMSLPAMTASRGHDRSIVATAVVSVLTFGHIQIYDFTMSAAEKIHSDNPDVPASEALLNQLSKVAQLLHCTMRRHLEHQTRTEPRGEAHELPQLQGKTLVLLSQMGLRRQDPQCLNEDLKPLLQSEDSSYV